ncbi:MAG: YARHG domain-containing protein [Clostridium sp.]|nr:YARHG domain-containing protein [Clostridium sp.]
MRKNRKRNGKKRIAVCIILAGILLLTACRGRSASTGNDKGSDTDKDISNENMVTDKTKEEQLPDFSYTWQEITVTLPGAWKDRCVIEDYEDGFSIYQKASYEERAGSGFICGYYRTKEYMDYGMGEELVAYSEDGMLYYRMQPTDVDCATEDEAVMGEYITMCNQAAERNASLQITASGIHYDAEEYVIAISSIYPLNEDYLQYLSDNDLWIAKNEIYARHGRQFNNEYLQQYFNRCTWYEGTIPAEQFEESTLSQLEQDNIGRLEAAKEEYARRHPYPKEYSASDTAMEDLTGDGTLNQIRYQVTGQDNGEYQCEVMIDGEAFVLNDLAYIVSPDEAVFYVTDIREDDNQLEIAVLDYGPSSDPVTTFYYYDGSLQYFGQVSGIPFANQNGGINGFNGIGGVTGQVRMDLIETTYLKGYWWYDREINWMIYQDSGWNEFLPTYGHALYENLPVHYEMDEASETLMIPAQEEVYFLGSDMYEWILVRGKDGREGYMHVVDGEIVDLNTSADQIFSDLYFFD